MNKSVGFGILILGILFLQLCPAFANKAVVTIEGPTRVAKGTEVTLRIIVTHNANSASHHIEWVKVTANQKEIAGWKYSKGTLPEAAEFIKEIKIKVMEETEVVGEASCNKHGGKGPAKHKITAK